MRALIATVLAASVAVGAGYGTGVLLKSPTGQEGTAAPVRQAVVADADAMATAVAAPSYLDVGQLVVPIVQAGQTKSYLLAQMKLEIPDPATADAVAAVMPRVRNAMLQTLYGLAAAGFFDRADPDVNRLGQILTHNANSVLGEGIVRAVLFDRLLQQANTRL